MDVDTLRAFAQGVHFDTVGVPIVVTRPSPDDTPVSTTGIWLVQPLDETRPVGTDFQRRDPRKALAIKRDATLPTLPRGTLITAPETIGGVIKTWQVDGFDRPAEVDEWRAIVKLIADQ